MSRGDRNAKQRTVLIVAVVLLAAVCLGVLWLAAGPVRAQSTAPAYSTPSTPWLTLAETTVLERIAVGSCLDQRKPQPIWSDILAKAPQLMLMAGDNVYGDMRAGDPAELAQAYRLQAVQPELALARSRMPFLAIWDDHDFGRNDGGADFRQRPVAARLFHAFWQTTPLRPLDDGIYHGRIYGPPGRRVQILMLDARSQRSPLKAKSPAFPYAGRYEPDDDPAKTMLGAAQWAWLEAELAKPAEIRLIVSGVQVTAEGHGWERWGNLPHERERLVALIARTQGATVLISGDRHAGSLYRSQTGDRALYELTSSALNLPIGAASDTPMPPLVSRLVNQENFGLIGIDWAGRTVSLSLHGLAGANYVQRTIPFSEVGVRS